MFVVVIKLHELWSSLGDLSEFLRDWGWLVDDEILKSAAGNVMADEAVLLFLLVGEDEFLGDWNSGVLNEVDETFLSDILAVKNANIGSWRWSLLLEGLSGVTEITIVVVWEAFVESGGQMRNVSWNCSIELWSRQSSNHHADGDVIVIIWILGLVSIFIKNRFEGIITDDLSEGFEGYGVDNITLESG